MTEAEKKVLSLLKADRTLSIAELKNRTAMSRASVERALKGLKEKENITREGAKKMASGLLKAETQQAGEMITAERIREL